LVLLVNLHWKPRFLPSNIVFSGLKRSFKPIQWIKIKHQPSVFSTAHLGYKDNECTYVYVYVYVYIYIMTYRFIPIILDYIHSYITYIYYIYIYWKLFTYLWFINELIMFPLIVHGRRKTKPNKIWLFDDSIKYHHHIILALMIQ
jgi:hypothetical protein